ncbi:carbohydrate-binding module family 14 protein [Roseobacter sp. YSTF-M11]|uniref:Carbohydrate-binding module family 14 protein n=1 Tax=Roseobacter insulae TaxID=2859783 RepID=A0A9X1JYP6_9RHOB|nr:carbohydrate-binding module family 14 protein [Roseobacter insulae]MBW4708496.1 carbohydrate-binding module family 14 protein [Roseobacter insulae]
MTIKTLAAAVALTVAPMLAYAEGCSYGKKVTMSCAEGTIYDSATNSCVATTT